MGENIISKAFSTAAALSGNAVRSTSMASKKDEKKPSGNERKDLLSQRVEPPTPEQLDWSIAGRMGIQKTMLRLYKLFVDHEDKLETRKTLGAEGRDLISIAFSLWRAVFLSDRFVELRNYDARDFLEKVLTDNAIGFPQDRSMRSWTFYYYRDNAYLRLLAHTDDKELLNGAPIFPPKGKATTQRQWEVLHEGLIYLVGEFEKELLK